MTIDPLNISEISVSQENKEATANAQTLALAQAGNQLLSIAISGNTNLTSAQYDRNYVFVLTGTPGGAFDLNTLATARVFHVVNNTDSTATVQVVGGGGAGVDLATGEQATLQCNGTDVIQLSSGGSGGSGSGFHIVDAASTGNLTLSGEQTVDGVATSASRVLVKDQTTPAQNGIYLTGAGAWTRATDFDAATTGEVATGAPVYVAAGDVNARRLYTLATTGAITVGSTALSFQQPKASPAAANVSLVRRRGALVYYGSNANAQDLTTLTALSFNTVAHDSDSIYDAGNPTRLTVPVGSGIKKIRLKGAIRLDNVLADNDLFLRFRRDGTDVSIPGLPSGSWGPDVFTLTAGMIETAEFEVDEGDYFEFTAQYTTDTSVDIAANITWFAMEVVEHDETPVKAILGGAVRAVATSNVDIDNDLENGDSLDGLTLATGERVLLVGQSDASENGVYVVVASGTASRATDWDDAAEVVQFKGFRVSEGTVGAGKAYVLTSETPLTVDTDDQVFEEFFFAIASVEDDSIGVGKLHGTGPCVVGIAEGGSAGPMVEMTPAQVREYINIHEEASAVASASTIDCSAIDGDFAHITGTTTITAFSNLEQGREITFVLDSTPTIEHDGTALINITGDDIIGEAGDIFTIRGEDGSSNARMTQYQRASGAPVTDESGTFTPVVSFGGGSTGLTHAIGPYGYYEKEAKKCYINISIFLSSKGSSTGNASVDSLPFTSSADTQRYGIGVAQMTTLNGDFYNATSAVLVNSSSISLSKLEAGGGFSNFDDADFNNTTTYVTGMDYPLD